MPKLFCVPLLVKDNYDTLGMSATNGAYGLIDNYPSQDSYQVWLIFASAFNAGLSSFFRIKLLACGKA